jgi:hypothetical protein
MQYVRDWPMSEVRERPVLSRTNGRNGSRIEVRALLDCCRWDSWLWPEAVRRGTAYSVDLELDSRALHTHDSAQPQTDLPARPPRYFSFFNAAKAFA